MNNGSKVRIKVTSESGLTKEYLFNIHKKEKSNIFIPLVIFTFSIIVFVFVLLFVRKRKSNKKELSFQIEE